MTAMKSSVTTIPSSLAFWGLFAIWLCSMIFIVIGLGFRTAGCRLNTIIQTGDKIGTPDASQALLDGASLLGLIPEEVLSLGEFLAWGLGAEYLFECVGVVASIPSFSGICHRCWREVLHLFEVKIELLGDDGELGHIGLVTAWVGGDEVGDDLLVQSLLAVDTVEDTLKFVELLERGFAHES